MKKYKHKYTVISLLYMIGMLFTGCDGFLDVELDNQIKLEEVFNKRSTTEQYLAQVYGFVPQTYNWHENAVGASVPMSDEALFSWMSGLGYHSFLNGTWSVTTTSYAIWKNMYQAINQATVFMNHVDECVELTQKEKDIMKAEARFLRAYFYTLLINQYGPVYVWGDQDSDSSIHAEDIDRHPLEANVQFVLEEYDKAAEVLPLQMLRPVSCCIWRVRCLMVALYIKGCRIKTENYCSRSHQTLKSGKRRLMQLKLSSIWEFMIWYGIRRSLIRSNGQSGHIWG